MSTLQAINCCHVQRCAARQISNDVAMSVFLEISTLQRYALAMSLNPLMIYLIKPLHVQFIFQYPVNSPVTHVTKKLCIVTRRSTFRQCFTNLMSLVLDFDTGRPHLSSSIIVSRPSMHSLCHLYIKDRTKDGFSQSI